MSARRHYRRRSEREWLEHQRRTDSRRSRAAAKGFCSECGGVINAGAPIKHMESARPGQRPAIFHPGHCYEAAQIKQTNARWRRDAG